MVHVTPGGCHLNGRTLETDRKGGSLPSGCDGDDGTLNSSTSRAANAPVAIGRSPCKIQKVTKLTNVRRRQCHMKTQNVKNHAKHYALKQSNGLDAHSPPNATHTVPLPELSMCTSF